MAEGRPARRGVAVVGGAVVGALLRLGGHGRATSSGWWVLEPAGVVAVAVALAVGLWAFVGAVRSDDADGRPLAPRLALLAVLGWALLGLVGAVLALVWL